MHVGRRSRRRVLLAIRLLVSLLTRAHLNSVQPRRRWNSARTRPLLRLTSREPRLEQLAFGLGLGNLFRILAAHCGHSAHSAPPAFPLNWIQSRWRRDSHSTGDPTSPLDCLARTGQFHFKCRQKNGETGIGKANTRLVRVPLSETAPAKAPLRLCGSNVSCRLLGASSPLANTRVTCMRMSRSAQTSGRLSSGRFVSRGRWKSGNILQQYFCPAHTLLNDSLWLPCARKRPTDSASNWRRRQRRLHCQHIHSHSAHDSRSILRPRSRIRVSRAGAAKSRPRERKSELVTLSKETLGS